MKRVHCIVEGQTEVQVFYAILSPYIKEKTGEYIEFTPIKHTGGGMVKYSKLIPEFRNHLKDKDKILTTFFDYYGINENHNFPNYKEAKKDQQNSINAIELIEQGIKNDLNERSINTRNFLPYIQLHEFEAILYSSEEGFNFQFDNANIISELIKVKNRFPNPEDINDSPITAPSKRLIQILKDNNEKYNKIVDGESIARQIGIETILDHCPRFNNWVNQLIKLILKS